MQVSDVRQITYRVEVGRPNAADYARAKRLLNIGRHPTFVGRDMVARCARNGGLLFFVVDGLDAAVVLVNPRNNVLTVMCVRPNLRGCGLGGRVLQFVKPNFVRAVEGAVPWFERQGYKPIGEWKIGRALRTRMMVRESLISLAGRLRSRLENTAASSPQAGPYSRPAPARVATQEGRRV